MVNEIKAAYPIEINHSSAAKRISLRVKRDLSCFVLTLPKTATLKQGQVFTDIHSGWLISASRHLRALTKIEDGSSFSFLGDTVTVFFRPAARGKAERNGNDINVFGYREFFGHRLKNFLEKELLDYIKQRISDYESIYPFALPYLKGGRRGKIAIHNTTSRWGSCSSSGNLSFCFNLCFADKPIIDYVIAHELSHLKEMNHSPAFWATVESLYPDWKNARKWLKNNGTKLHSFTF